MFKPTSTYRIQFHQHFTFKDLEKYVPYLAKLGIGAIYASPIFTAIPGSSHGHDGVNPLQINPEIGDEQSLIRLSKLLQKNGISWIQDIVPNHMSFHPDNLWLMDVLEKWDPSPFFNYFDLNFETCMADKRLMVPFLGENLESAIQELKVNLVIDDEQIKLRYGDNNWPINEQTYSYLNELGIKVSRQSGINKKSLKIIQTQLDEINKNTAQLAEIAEMQYYRLCHWQETEQHINYRRFFLVNSLICLQIDREEVFEHFHRYILSLTKKGIIQGLRIDHIDGLANPGKYLDRLRLATGKETYIVVEKILGKDEHIPKQWPIQGSTGYKFLSIINNLLTNTKAERDFSKFYNQFISKPLEIAEQTLKKKRLILHHFMTGELEHLYCLSQQIELLKRFSKVDLKHAIANFLIHCPVYRFYGQQLPLSDDEIKAIKVIFQSIPKKPSELEVYDALVRSFFRNAAGIALYSRCMQFSGPLTAKGIEDTLMYTYNRFAGHTEVGDSVEGFGLSVDDFHQHMLRRFNDTPYALNATSTHDTKRGEDVRARLNTLTENPKAWMQLVRKISALSTQKLHQNDAYLIIQSIFGALPFEVSGEEDFKSRLMAFIEKALREAKKRSNWAKPNTEYEEQAKAFALELLDSKKETYKLIRDYLDLLQNDARNNSYIQVILKCLCPGIPDFYQGTELWDLSLVDPDNRRLVDFERRSQLIEEDVEFEAAWKRQEGAQFKLWLSKRLLHFRKEKTDLFNEGIYMPLEVTGINKAQILAFGRRFQEQFVVVIVAFGREALRQNITKQSSNISAEKTKVILPRYLSGRAKNVLSEAVVAITDNQLLVEDILDSQPFAVLDFSEAHAGSRSSGVLLPVFSLNGHYGIGDMGSEAFRFVDMLSDTSQHFWQLLPLNPVSEAAKASPYSAYSAMAGNTFFIDPAGLLADGWIDQKDLPKKLKNTGKVNYKAAGEIRDRLLALGYENFKSRATESQISDFEDFCKVEAYWLANFSLFIALRNHHDGLSWDQWEESFRQREPAALKEFLRSNLDEVKLIRWQQYIFHQQWLKLRKYANRNRVKLIGDLPFYVAYDSADVWANPESFQLDDQLRMQVVAGVPPDGHAPDGQLWGLPIFDWQYLKTHQYAWWMQRIQRNIELFDLVRIDHFRAIHSYWEIPANEQTAINGRWLEGPGANFLSAICEKFKDLPFVVEDLGGDMEGAIQLKQEFKLAGMKVLQFSFGGDFPNSPFLPHNFEDEHAIVYVGTHDNNTAKGWFLEETNAEIKKNLALYLGFPVTSSTVHLQLMRLAMSTRAKISILQMQDLLGLGGAARTNTPGTILNNWEWRMKRFDLPKAIKDWLSITTKTYGRS